VNYSTEASYLSRLGVPAVVCGAGDIAHAHQADEKLPKKEIPEYRRILQDLIREYCLR
jgi:acetylornithine deacetylase